MEHFHWDTVPVTCNPVCSKWHFAPGCFRRTNCLLIHLEGLSKKNRSMKVIKPQI